MMDYGEINHWGQFWINMTLNGAIFIKYILKLSSSVQPVHRYVHIALTWSPLYLEMTCTNITHFLQINFIIFDYRKMSIDFEVCFMTMILFSWCPANSYKIFCSFLSHPPFLQSQSNRPQSISGGHLPNSNSQWCLGMFALHISCQRVCCPVVSGSGSKLVGAHKKWGPWENMININYLDYYCSVNNILKIIWK